ncbi:DUF4199 domain-containing protein [Aestuariibaculum marinum]|uniref:DUF4199 domain-containing protein n=1 Tax=Aestuariibaculum marinum TaxID=2683592 RepID=A0A8J6QDH3_9FLAO|nr:DUF4199 domain-containing protein [Aestuariibaculum marinum]MBD0825096.1 DUF4199 domain-containing protein [Aestuariibaculum marinum]
MEKSLKSTATNLGLILGALLTLYTAVAYLFKRDLLVNLWVITLIIPLFIIGYGIFSTAKIKSLQNGFLSFKEAFSGFFIPVAIGIMVSTLITIILFNFIDTDAAIEVKNLLIENTVGMLKNAGAPTDIIAEKVEEIESQDTFSLGIQLKSLAQSLIFFAVIGLIVAAAMKKSKPANE